MLIQAVEKAGYIPGKMSFGIDAAANSFYVASEEVLCARAEHVRRHAISCSMSIVSGLKKYFLVSIEDALHEGEGWAIHEGDLG